MARQKRYGNGYLRKTFTYYGKKYYVYGRTPAELLEKENAKRQNLEKGVLEVINPSLNNYYEHFTEIRRREIKESTIRSQRCQYELIAGVQVHNSLKFGEMRIKDITRRDIENVRQSLLNTGKTPQHLNNCFAHLNHVFNSALIDETIQKNPCKALKQLKRDTPLIGENRHRALTESETQLFFKVAEERNSYYINIFRLMIKSGMRIGEVSALYLTDIDKVKGFIHVRRTIMRNEAGTYIVGNDAKTKSGARDIPLTEDMLESIKQQQYLNRLVHSFVEDNGLIFKSAEGGILREYSVNREIKRICKMAGIETFTCHAFRNTFATRFIEQRPQDYKILSEILGHKDVSITLNLYTHVMSDNKITAMQELRIKTS